MVVIYIVIGLAVGLGVGIALSATKLRNALEKKSVQVLKEAEEKSEILKKEKILQAKEKSRNCRKKVLNFLLQRIISTNRPKDSKYANRKSRKHTGKA